MATAHETLGGLKAKGHKHLQVDCARCTRFAYPDIEPLIERFGANHGVPDLARHFRCEQCGRKDLVSTQPDALYSRGS